MLELMLALTLAVAFALTWRRHMPRGFYVAATLYIGLTAWRQGGFRLWVGLAIGAGFAISLYLIFETIFQIPLLKGPLEPLLGIY